MRTSTSRICSLMAAGVWRSALRARGCTLVVTNGCFDILHAGHVESLERARAEGDALLVLLNSDESVRALKGPGRPIVPQEQRAILLAALRSVDCVLIFNGQDCGHELAHLGPDVYAKSVEYATCQNENEAAALEGCRARMVWLPRSAGLSTTAIAERIRGAAPEPLPRDQGGPSDSPRNGAPANVPQSRDIAAAPVADASTREEADAKLANAGGADAGAMEAEPESTRVSGAGRTPGGSVGDASPRPPEALVSMHGGQGLHEVPRAGNGDTWGVP